MAERLIGNIWLLVEKAPFSADDFFEIVYDTVADTVIVYETPSGGAPAVITAGPILNVTTEGTDYNIHEEGLSFCSEFNLGKLVTFTPNTAGSGLFSILSPNRKLEPIRDGISDFDFAI